MTYNLFCTEGQHWTTIPEPPRYDINPPCPSCVIAINQAVKGWQEEAKRENKAQRGIR